MLTRINLVLLLCFAFNLALAQVTIYSEDFSGYPNATTNSPGLWTSSGTDCDDPGLNNGNQYGVYNGAFTVNEVEGAPCCAPEGGGNDNNWETVTIDISTYCEVQFSLNTTSSGDLECLSPGIPIFACQGVTSTDDFHDQMVITYVLDGVPTQAAYICGDNGVGPISVTNLVGNTLLIRIQAANKFGSETYTWDDVLVEGFEPQMVTLNVPQTVFCENDPAIFLSTFQSGIPGTWSGPGVIGNQFDPDLAGPGNPILTFTPNPGECALPATIQMTVTAAPIGISTNETACVDVGGFGIFDLTALNFTVAGGFAQVNWYFDMNLNNPINNPNNFITPTSTTVFAEVVIGGCGSDPIPVDLNVESCDIPTPTLSCSSSSDVDECTVCENGIFPNETVTLFVNFPFIPPGGFDLTITFGNMASGFQNQTFPSFMGQPLNFLISEDTEFFVSMIECPNGCPDVTDLGNVVTFLYNDQPIITDPGDPTACGQFTLPPITGLNIPADAAYYTLSNGMGMEFQPGDIITSSTTLFIFASDGECFDEVTIDITIDPLFDAAWTTPSVPCGSSTILLTPDGTPGGTWSGIGITDNGDGTATFDPNAAGAGDVTYAGGTAPCDASLTQTITISAGGADTTFIDIDTCDPLAAGSDTTFLMNQAGCDSLVITNTILQLGDTITITANTCDPIQAGLDTVFLMNQFGCDSLIITETLLLDSDTTTLFAMSCDPAQVGSDTTFLLNQDGCDSLVITETMLSPSDTTNLTAFTCDPMMAGLDTTFLMNQAGCDSLVVVETILLSNDTTLIDQTTCDPAMVSLDTAFLMNQAGCDSLVITNTTLAPSDTLFIDDTSCDLAQVGLDTAFLMNQFGCDSLIITNTTFIDSDTTLLFEASCNPIDTGTTVVVLAGTQCDSVIITTTSLLPSDTLFLSDTSCDPVDVGLDTAFLMNQFGCDSLIITNTTLVADDTTLIFQASCNPLDTGVVVDIFAGAQCDSIVITTTDLLLSDTTQLSATSCDPLQVGMDTIFLMNQDGCDSLVITTTTLLPSDTVTINLTTCDPMMAGSDSLLLQNQFGCDSLVITNTALLPSDTTQLNASTCDPLMVGMDTTFLNNQFGCDSLVITTTTLDPSDTLLLTVNTCDPAQAGIDTSFLQNQFGCDSLVITTTLLDPSDTIQLMAITCDMTQAGIDTLFLQNQFGCDSLIITNTTFVDADTTLLTANSCNPLDTGMVVEVLMGSQCDSVVITTTTLLPSDTIQVQATTCDPAQAGVDTSFLFNQFGCDSLVITNTTLLPSDTTNLMDTTCDPAQAGTFTVVLQNQFGCDSTVITQVDLLPSDDVAVQATTCDPAQVGTTVAVFQNQFGCDSTVTTTTSLLPSDEVMLEAETCDPAQAGTTVEVFQNQFGCDSTVITNTTLIPAVIVNNFPTICAGDSILINTTWYSASNTTGSDTLVSSLGCDSILNVFLSFHPAPQTLSITEDLCFDEVFEYDGVTYDINNPSGIQTIQSVETGCDSIIADIQLNFETIDAVINTETPSCEDLANGSLTIESIFGIGDPYSYSLDSTALIPLDQLPFTVNNLEAGNYEVLIESASGCLVSVPVTIDEGPTPIIEFGESLFIELGESVSLNPAISFDYEQLIWTPADILPCDTCASVSFVPPGNTVISLTAIDSLGCTVTEEIEIFVNPNRRWYAPNAFSPDLDGVNDKFLIFTDPTQVTRIRTFQIFDRWGEQVFLQNNIDPLDLQAGWDGTFRGQDAPVDVFVYYAEIEYVDGVVEFVKGDVMLIR